MSLRPAILAALLLATAARAQTPAPAESEWRAPTLTILTTPGETRLFLTGESRFRGPAPLDIPATLTGRYGVTVEGKGISRAQATVRFPPRGEAPELISNPPGLSVGLVTGSLLPPGVPQILSGHAPRGALFTLAGVGAAFASVREHLRYQDRLDETGGFSVDRAEDERRARDAWFAYGAAAWGLGAIDHIIQSRVGVVESTPSHLSLRPTPITREGIIWRSMLVPGAGQEYANARARSAFWIAAALAAAAGYTSAAGEVERAETKLDWTLAYVDSGGPAQRAERLLEAERRRNDLDDARGLRRAFGHALAVIHAANLVDAMFQKLDRSPATGRSVSFLGPAPHRSSVFGVALRF